MSAIYIDLDDTSHANKKRKVNDVDFECPVCKDPMAIPMVSECGHSICKMCYEIMTLSNKSKCVICNRMYNTYSVNQLAKNLIHSIMDPDTIEQVKRGYVNEMKHLITHRYYYDEKGDVLNGIKDIKLVKNVSEKVDGVILPEIRRRFQRVVLNYLGCMSNNQSPSHTVGLECDIKSTLPLEFKDDYSLIVIWKPINPIYGPVVTRHMDENVYVINVSFKKEHRKGVRGILFYLAYDRCILPVSNDDMSVVRTERPSRCDCCINDATEKAKKIVDSWF